MNGATETPLSSYHRQLEASRTCAQSAIEGASKIEAFILDSTRRQVDRAVDFAEACTGARDAEGVTTLQYTFFGHGSDEVAEAQKQLTNILLQTGVSMSAALAQMMPDHALFAVDAAGKTAVPGSKAKNEVSHAAEPWNAWTQAWLQWARASDAWFNPILPPIVTEKPKRHAPRL